MAIATILGIETSCDETAAAVLRADPGVFTAGGDDRILSSLVLSQIDEHKLYGGVVPEIAARAHMDHLDRLIEAALEEAGLELGDMDAIAATAGPGLIGGVLVGVVTSKAGELATNLGNLAAGESTTVTIQGIVDSSAKGTLVNTARVSAPNETNLTNNSDDAVIWMEYTRWEGSPYYHFEVFLSGNARVLETGGTLTTGPVLFVTFNAVDPVSVHADVHTFESSTNSKLYIEASRVRDALHKRQANR